MTSRMFPFITRTHNPIGGGHVIQKDGKITGCYNCVYCWATSMKNQYKWQKYLGTYRFIEKELLVRYKKDDFTFVCDMIDIGRVPIPILIQFFNWLEDQPGKILTLTKNPRIYMELIRLGIKIPENVYLGATIESNKNYPDISKAPSQDNRLYWMTLLSQIESVKDRLFISIEPVMAFDLKIFETSIYCIKPWAVAIGYDNYNSGLLEQDLMTVKELISRMGEYTTVYTKTLRDSLPSMQSQLSENLVDSQSVSATNSKEKRR